MFLASCTGIVCTSKLSYYIFQSVNKKMLRSGQSAQTAYGQGDLCLSCSHATKSDFPAMKPIYSKTCVKWPRKNRQNKDLDNNS